MGKPTKISVGKKKKTPSPLKELRKRPSPEKVEKVRIVNKQKPSTVLWETNGKTKQQQTVQPLKISVKSSQRAKSPAKEGDPEEEVVDKHKVVKQHTWRGKASNSRTLRSDQDGAEHPAQPTGRQCQDRGRDWQVQQGGGARRLWHLRDARPTHRPGQHEPRGDHRVGWLRLSAMVPQGLHQAGQVHREVQLQVGEDEVHGDGAGVGRGS